MRNVGRHIRLWLIFAGALLAQTPFAVAEPSGATVTAVVPTDRRNPAPGEVGALKLSFEALELGRLSDVMSRVRPVLPEFSARRPPAVPFYLSKNRPPEERLALLNEARAQLRAAFPGIEPKIEVRYLEEEKVDVERISRRVGELIDATERALPADKTTKKAMEALREANEKALRETLLFRLTKPAVADKLVQHMSSVKAVVTLVSRAGQTLSGGSPDASQLLSGLALVGSDTSIEYYSTRYEMELGRAFAEHNLPGSSKSAWLSRLNETYQSDAARFMKGSAGIALAFGVARPAMLQQLGHWNNPSAISAVSGADIGTMAGASVVSSLLYFGGFEGLEKLRKKGWMNQPAIDIALRGASFLWQAQEVALSLGPLARPFLPFILGPMWATYGGAMLGGFWLPPRNDRFVLVDTDLSKFMTSVHYIEGIGDTRRVKLSPQGFAAAVRESKKAPALSRKAAGWSMLNPCRWAELAGRK